MNVKRLNKILVMLFAEMNGMTDEGRDLPILWNVMHMYSSLQIAKILALRRGMDMELAAITAALHDIAVIVTKKTEGHAERAEKYLRDIINRYNKEPHSSGQNIDKEEEDKIVSAVIQHSNKENYTNDPFVELLKDVDSVDRYLHGVKTEGAYLERCNRVLRELGIER